MKKILILYAKYGGGHLSAANSIQTYIEEHYFSNCEVKSVDCVDYVSTFANKVSTNIYKKMAIKTPGLWKKLYYGSANKGFLSHLSDTANNLMARKLYKLFKEYSPEIVISTHPFASHITSLLKQKNKINCKLATVLTDFAPHAQWLIGNEYGNYFFVSNDKMKDMLINDYNIPCEKVFSTGIPLSNTFSYPFYDDETYKNYNLKPNKKTILFFGGR